MQDAPKAALLRLGGVSACVASLAFFLTVVHLLGVLPLFGLQMEMLDNRALLLPWLVNHGAVYGVLWQLYFLSQMFLLPVPLALYVLVAQEGSAPSGQAAALAVAGTAATTMAMVGAVVVYSTSLPVAQAYINGAASSQTNTLLLGDLFADVGKELRLFSELLLGIWLGGTGVVLFRQGRTGIPVWLLVGVGAYTCVVAAVKIFNPLTSIEDTLGFLLAFAYVSIGWLLLRSQQSTVAVPQPA